MSFYNHAYLTPCLRSLLVTTLRRLTGKGGEPVIQTKTEFGGSKTHSLIALYHLVRSADALMASQSGSDSPSSREIRAVMEEAGYTQHSDGLG